MEIVLLPPNALRFKGKQATLLLNASDDKETNSAILSYDANFTLPLSVDTVLINNPGEYEIGGIKITGLRSGESTVFSLKIDGIDILLGKIDAVEKIHQKIKEHNIVILSVEENIDASFVTGLAVNSVFLYGEKASDVLKTFAKESTKEMSKYQTTLDKLPSELETILLASS